MRIGVPRALMFYRYYPFLRVFLEGCGHQVVASPPTDLRILEMGVESCVDDVCVAVKVFFGHVRFLEGRAEALLVPRVVSVERAHHDTFTCPKLIAAPDMVRFLRGRPPLLLEWVLDAGRAPWWWGSLRLAARLRVPPLRAWRALRHARLAQSRYESLLALGWPPDAALDIWERRECGGAEGMRAWGEVPERRVGERMVGITSKGTALPGARSGGRPGFGGGGVAVGVVGHPYLLGDGMVNKGLLRWLEEEGAVVVH